MSDPKRAELETKAREAVGRLEKARAIGRQLELLPVPASPEDPGELEAAAAPRGPGRPPGSRNRSSSKLRRMLAARGFRMPEDVLVETAGLASRETALDLAMTRAEQVLAWAFGPNASPHGGQRLAAFLAIIKEQTNAASALLPYGLEKMNPDQAPTGAPTFIVLPGGAAPRPGDRARIVDHQAAPSASDAAPPPMPEEIEENQGLARDDPAQSDGSSRTE